MTDTSTDNISATNAAQVQPPGTARPASRRHGLLPPVAFLLAASAIAMHFYPDIRDAAEKYVGPLTWLPKSIGSMQRLPPVAQQDSAAVITIVFAEIEELQASLVKLRTTTEQISVVKEEAATALKAAEDAGGKADALNGQIAALEATTRQQDAELKTSVEGLTEVYSKLAAPSQAPLIAARLTLLAVNGALTPNDVDPLAALVGGNPALTEIAAQLKALAGEDVLTIVALQAHFNASKNDALQKSLSMRRNWMEIGFSAAQAALSEIGIIHREAEEKDEIVISEVTRQLDNGRLTRALFELQAASPELSQQLAAWISAAQLRVNLDTLLQQLIDGLLNHKASPTKPIAAD